MKLAVLGILAAGMVLAQPIPIIKVSNGAPTGGCGANQLDVNLTNGDLYDCLNSVWHLATGGGGGSIGGGGTTNTVAKFTAASIIGNSSITDNGTQVATPETVAIGQGSGTGGAIQFFGSSSGSATIAVNPVAGAPSPIYLPVADGTPGQLLQTDGQNPANLSWTTVNPGYPANQILAGCGVEYVSGLTFTVGACQYTIAGKTYNSPLATVTLAAADPTNPRLDDIIVDNTGAAGSITGTPAATPVAPVPDPSTQLGLTIGVQVAANATTPSNITATLLYDENVEWACTASANLNCASTNNPYHGSLDIEATAAVLTNNVTLVKPAAGTVDLATQNALVFYIRSKGLFPVGAGGSTAARSISISWLNGASAKGNVISLRDGAFGFSSSNTTGYQQVSIPTSVFGINGVPVTTLQFVVAGPSGSSSIGFYLDQVTLQAGFSPSILPTTLMNWRGTWSATTAYNPNDTVVSGGVGYVALAANVNIAVSTTATWAVLGSASLAAQANATFLGNVSGGSAVPTATAIPTSAHGVHTSANGALGAQTGHDLAAVLTCATSSASGTAETCNTSPTFTPAAGDSIIFQADVANTGAFTLNVNSQGAKGVKKNGTAALVANDILASPFQVLMTYDGTNWEMQGQLGNASGAGGGCTATKYTITQSPAGTTWTVTGQSGQSVTASTTTQTINIVTLASKTVINWLRIKHTTAFAGTSITAYTMSLGTNASGGSTTSFEPAFNVFSAVGDSPFGATPGYLDDGGSFSGADNGETVTATFISTGGNLTATTAGSVDVTLCTTTLP